MNSRKKVNFAKLEQASAILASLALPIISGTTTHATPVRPRVTKSPSPTTHRLPATRPLTTNSDPRRLTLYNGLYDSIYGHKKTEGVSGVQPKPISARIVAIPPISGGKATSEKVPSIKMISKLLTDKQPPTKPLTTEKLTIGKLTLKPLPTKPSPTKKLIVSKLTIGKLTLKPLPAKPSPDQQKPISDHTVTTSSTPIQHPSDARHETQTTTTLSECLANLRYIEPTIKNILIEAEKIAGKELHFPVSLSLTDPVAFREGLAEYSRYGNEGYFIAIAFTNEIRRILDSKNTTSPLTLPIQTLIGLEYFDPFD